MIDNPKNRIVALMVFCIGLASAVLARAAYVQIFSNPRLEHMANRQFQSKVLIQPRRGAILDRNGEPLAINSETQSLAMNPSKVHNKHNLAHLISKATDVPYVKLITRISDDTKQFVWIKRHLTENDLNRLRKFHLIDGEEAVATGLWLVRESERAYPHGELAAHVIGDVNLDSQGTEGTELWMNEHLRGKVISMTAIKDALGRAAFIDSSAAKSAQDGKDGEPVTLTLDASLQYATEEALRSAVHRTGARSGTVIVMNSVTGEILAMANDPAFNPNDRSAPAETRRNRAVTDGYEPGSTMKSVLLASALSNGMKLSDQVFGEHGKFKLQGRTISEAETKEKFDWISLKKIIQVSSNIGAAKVALKVGADHYLATLKSFGFGSKTDVGFPGEISGRVPPRKGMQPLSLANIGFGQGVLVTPLQMTRAYATFLNGGWLVEPTLIRDPAEKREPPKRILSEKVCGQVLEALQAVTDKGGTGEKAVVAGYRVAGKTGTAQKVDPATGAYSRSKHIASFIGFALDVDPKLVIFTSLDEPKGVYFAAETAVPLFREVLTEVANRYSLPERRLASDEEAPAGARTTSTVAAAHPAPRASWAPPKLDPAVELAKTGPLEWIGTQAAGQQVWRMPLLKGLTAREAMQRLKGHSFQLELEGSGLIRSQAPMEGKEVADGETVKLNLSESP